LQKAVQAPFASVDLSLKQARKNQWAERANPHSQRRLIYSHHQPIGERDTNF